MGKITIKLGANWPYLSMKKYEQGQKNSQNVPGGHVQWNVGKLNVNQ